FVYRGEISTNLTAKLVVRKQSDREVIRDFFESEYRENVEPNSFLEINRQWENSSLNLLSQARMNDFFETVERLPDLKYTSLRQQLGVSPIFYESESSAGYYRHKFVDDELPEFTAFRADTYHQLLVPKTFFNWLNVTPKAGGRFTHYGEAGGSGGLTNERDRWIFNTGVELSTKVWRVWKNTKSDFLQVDGLRHIFEPTLNYVFVPKPDARPGEIPQFDTVQPHLRLLPIDFPDFNSIDAIDGQNTLRFGIRNKFQTKRNGKIDNLIHWHLLMDWRLDPGIDNKNYSDVYSYLDFKPRDWLILTSEVRVDADDGRLNQSNHSIDYRPNETWSILLGHWFLDSNDGLLRRPYIADPGPFDPEGNNLIYTNFFYRFNEEWGINLRHYFEARDGTMEEQDYTLYRDLRSWTAGLTFRVRESRTDSTDFTVAVTFSFKAVPRYDVGDDVEQMPLLLGG
ncbi:MAG TPA: LPS-assembly protein LptD, partial [Verrucomicrobia bacterium]|nr:LPS-assembly protein LptD [Verrucomicrobiota bacterium]